MTKTTSSLRSSIQRQYRARAGSERALKVNLYKGYEVDAVCDAFAHLRSSGSSWFPDCFMVADSFLTTHLSRPSTKLSEFEREAFLDLFLTLVKEVRISLDKHPEAASAYLVADMPDGNYGPDEFTLGCARRMLDFGADCVKFEITSQTHIAIVDHLSRSGVVVMAHLGYAPQHTTNQTYGRSLDEALRLFSLARQLRDAGAAALVLERVSPPVNIALSKISDSALPTYSIFSGVAPNGGLSLNVWDSTVKPPFVAKFFPPTATISPSQVGELYKPELISRSFCELLNLVRHGRFPSSPQTADSQRLEQQIADMNAWT